MNAEQIQTLVSWLNAQISIANTTISEAQQSNDYGRLAGYEGKKEAYCDCLARLTAKMSA